MKAKELIWKRLLNNKCPKCNKELDFQSDDEMMMCTFSCGFMVTPTKMNDICGKLCLKKI